MATRTKADEIPEEEFYNILDEFIAKNRKLLEDIGRL